MGALDICGQQNDVERYRCHLLIETNFVKRATLFKLLANEEAKQAARSMPSQYSQQDIASTRANMLEAV